MTCAICHGAIRRGDTINRHHPTYKSNGGAETVPAHQRCHIRFHSLTGDFKAWGRIGGQISALTKRWSLNLLNVRTHPAHEPNRQFYRLHYAHQGSAGMLLIPDKSGLLMSPRPLSKIAK